MLYWLKVTLHIDENGRRKFTAKTITGYKEYNTKRKYLVTLGDWRNNKDEEVELDGVGGVNILVKADVHRSGKLEHGVRNSSHVR